MKRFARLSVPTLLALSLILAAVHSAAAGPSRPFKAKGEALLAGNPFAGTDFIAFGTATHLGKFEAEGTTLFGSPDMAGVTVATGTITFIAANGDELDATFAGTLNLLTGEGTATFIFTGGTGRFDDASGEFEADIQQEGAAGFSFTADGDLEY